MTEIHPPHKKIKAELPLETIQFKLLPRLPAKSLGRFMCISKQWQSFLSTPEFARMHLHHVTMDESRAHHKLLLLDTRSHTFRLCMLDCEAANRCSTTSRSIPFEAHPCGVKILASLDGLVCASVTNMKTYELVFWNPLTSAYKKLSNSNFLGFYRIGYSVVTSFYIDSFNDYNLLYIVSGCALGAYIYSRRLDSWRKIQYLENIQHVSTYRWSQATFCGESIYFMLSDVITRAQRHIIVFDVKSEKFREQRFPPIPSGAHFSASLVVVNGFIHLFVFYRMEGQLFAPPQIDLWRMDGDRWIKVAAFSHVQGVPLTRSLISMMWKWTRLAIKMDDDHVYKIDMKNFFAECLSLRSGIHSSTIHRTMFVETLVSPNP